MIWERMWQTLAKVPVCPYNDGWNRGYHGGVLICVPPGKGLKHDVEADRQRGIRLCVEHNPLSLRVGRSEQASKSRSSFTGRRRDARIDAEFRDSRRIL